MIKVLPVSVEDQMAGLQRELQQYDLANLECVIFAHADNQMLTRLKDAFLESNVAILAMPQNQWSMCDQRTETLLDWLVNGVGIERLLLVGSSQGGTPVDTVQVCPTGQPDPNGSSKSVRKTPSPMDRVNLAQASARRTERFFVEQLNLLSLSRAIQGSLLQDQLQITGLYYRAEVGVFCHYDSRAQQFRALLPGSQF